MKLEINFQKERIELVKNFCQRKNFLNKNFVIAELSEQLSIMENQKNFNAHKKEIDFIGDIQSLKHNLEDWRKGLRLASVSMRDNSSTFITRGEGEVKEGLDRGSLKGFIEKEKNEISTGKTQKYNFKDDLDDIDNELKELEEMFNSK